MRSSKGEFVIIVGKNEARDFDLKNLDEQLRKLKKSNQDMLISGNKARKNPFFNMIQKKGKNSIKLQLLSLEK